MKEQRIIMYSRGFPTKSFNLDKETKELNEEGWQVIQISTAGSQINNNPIAVITLLLERTAPPKRVGTEFL